MKSRFGLITDVHYAGSAKTDSRALGGGYHLRRFSTSKTRFLEAVSFFNEENQRNGLDFWFSLGDEIDRSCRDFSEGEIKFAEFITDSRGVENVPFYLTQGHHTQYSFDPKYTAVDFTWNDYYNILFDPQTGNGGVIVNGHPGDARYPYNEMVSFNWPLSYTFTKNGIKFIVYTRYIGGDDKIELYYSSGHKEWLKNQLKTDLPVVIFSHCHLWINDNYPLLSIAFNINDWDTRYGVQEEDTIQYIIEHGGNDPSNQSNVIAVFGGHWHDGNRNMELNGIKYFSMPGSIKTSTTMEEYTSFLPSIKLAPVRAAAAEENAYFIVEIDDNLEVYINGYGYNGRKQSTGNFVRYEKHQSTKRLLNGEIIEINNTMRFSLLDDTILDVASSNKDGNIFVETEATLTVDGQNFIVGSIIDPDDDPSAISSSLDDPGYFVWDKYGSTKHIFDSGVEGETITFTSDSGKLIKVIWEGKGSHVFVVEVISGDTESTEIDASPITYYKAKIGESELESDKWYINYGKRHAFKVYKDIDPIEDV